MGNLTCNKLNEYQQEVLTGLTTYRLEHISRFGDYVLDFRRKVDLARVPNISLGTTQAYTESACQR